MRQVTLAAVQLNCTAVEASADREDIVLATIDLGAAARKRSEMPFFRDRRPDLYGALLTLDGRLGWEANDGGAQVDVEDGRRSDAGVVDGEDDADRTAAR